MRRLGLVLGALGAAGGTLVFSYPSLWQVVKDGERYGKYKQVLTSLPLDTLTVLKAGKCPGGVEENPFDKIVSQEPLELKTCIINAKGIHTISVWPNGEITNIEFHSGEKIVKIDPPSVLSYLIPLVWPLAGFLIPFGIIKTFTWVGMGFVEAERDE